ncbi:BTB/POZ domain-containing protein At3g05675-like [Typha angustifolia]|uniref:BTB/POZ domain-containing protein At3g05675-like n=1 Tax=Typha angustifolia TaxID=59011 RepID=UPI003C2BA20E
MSLRKRQRSGSSNRLSAPDGTIMEDLSSVPPPASIPGGFNDPSTADVVLRLQLESSDTVTCSGGEPDLHPPPPHLDLHLHSSALRRSRYFSVLLSGRWDTITSPQRITLKIPSSVPVLRRPFDRHVSVLRLLHTLDFRGSIVSASEAIDLLPIALELLFDELIQACLRFLEAVPWTEEEEECILSIIPLLPHDESRHLLARVSADASASEGMLHDLINSAMHSHPNVATVKAFVAKLLREYPTKDSVQMVLDMAFLSCLETVKELMGKYASPDLRVAGDNDEREAIQRLNLHAAVVNAKHLYWLIERMIELRVADNAVEEWSEQTSLAADLQKTLRDDAWKNIAPGLPSLVTRCTFRLASAVASGSTLAPQQVRMKLVKGWLPVLNVCRDIVSPMPSGHKSVFQELEETFLQIISTLPVADAQALLQQCLSFSTRNVDDCPHLIAAFKTWFRRADRSGINLNS